ncbi:Cystathionine beta-lyase [bioreactor metagenome]|uniref:Cystathionine beta-lyase n=1 Tax=bioreactor metagenome TaxID=1076179 RepID=A0A645ICT4_9ZZZZ
MDSWLILRGLKTLALRMKQHSFNAVKIAEWLTTQESVKEVYFIGLKNHPSSDIIERQCKGYGGMISFRVQNAEAAKQILNNIKIIRFAESLGGVESLMTYPMRQTHAEVPEERRKALGVDETLLRLSVGIEDVTDLINDLKQAFDNI